jgi:hypothetical protein
MRSTSRPSKIFVGSSSLRQSIRQRGICCVRRKSRGSDQIIIHFLSVHPSQISARASIPHQFPDSAPFPRLRLRQRKCSRKGILSPEMTGSNAQVSPEGKRAAERKVGSDSSFCLVFSSSSSFLLVHPTAEPLNISRAPSIGSPPWQTLHTTTVS